MSKKELLKLDEELAFKLQAEEDEEERLAREKAQKVEEANIAWDDIQAKVEADYQLAQRLQAQEQEEFSDAEKATLFVQLLEKRRKHFAAKRAEEKKEHTTNKSSAKEFHVSKRAGEALEQESSKKKKVDDDKESEELKQCMEIILDNGDDVTIEATPLSTKSPTIVNYKIYKEGKKIYFQIIIADGNSQMYLTFGKMLKNFDKEDLENILYNLLVEKMYPLIKYTLHQMFNDVKLQVDYECEMAFELFRLVKKQLKEGYGRIVKIKRLLDDLRVTAAQLMLL
ncbi:hypothetical protein Tco_1051131, partial [Tanacetum coccineum]